jgi:hypothetical protein
MCVGVRGQTGADLPDAIWIRDPDYYAGRRCDANAVGCLSSQNHADYKAEYIVIHATDGDTAEGAVAEFTNRADKSVHYIIANGKGPQFKDGAVIQMVRDADTDWAVGIWPEKSTGLHRGPIHHFNTINIELTGRPGAAGWCTEAMYSSAAKLIGFLVGKHGVPATRARILGHDEVAQTCVPPITSRFDPCGANPGRCTFDWDHLMSLVTQNLTSSSQPTSSSGLSRGLVAWYPFDGSLVDVSGNANPGVPTGAVSFTQGKTGQAIKLGGISNPGYVRVTDGPAVHFLDQFAWSCYLRVDGSYAETGYGDNAEGGWQCVIAKQGDRHGFYANVSLDALKRNLTLVSGIDVYGGGAKMEDTVVQYALGRWIHLAIVYGSGILVEYVDGQEIGRSPYRPTGLSSVNSDDLYLGIQDNGDLWYPLNGAIDDLRIYNRALSADEVRALASPSSATSTGSRSAASSLVAGSSPTAASSSTPGTLQSVWPVVLGGVLAVVLGLLLIRGLSG